MQAGRTPRRAARKAAGARFPVPPAEPGARGNVSIGAMVSGGCIMKGVLAWLIGIPIPIIIILYLLDVF